MHDNMHTAHMRVNADYALAFIHSGGCGGHNAAMAKKRRRPTFLREWRKVKPGRTLEKVAAEVGLSQPQLGRIERGDQPYNQDLLETLAEMYGCTVVDLLIRDPSAPIPIWSSWDRANPGVKRQIEEVAGALVRTGTEG